MGVRQAEVGRQGLAQWAYGWLLLRQVDKRDCLGREKEKRLVVQHQGLASSGSGKALDDGGHAGGVDVPALRVHLAAVAGGEAAGWGYLQQDAASLQAGLDGHLIGAGRDGHGRGRSKGRAHGNAGAAEAVTVGRALRNAAMVCGGALRVLCPRPLIRQISS